MSRPLPKFSVVTICYNHAEFIEKTISSVLEQNYPNFEHIIVDGGSTDDTISILKKYPHLHWTSERDFGVSNALNKGFKRCTGDIVAWINSDDYYLPGAFRAVAQAMDNKHIVLGDSFESDRQGNPKVLVKNLPRTYDDLLKYWVPNAWLAQPSVFFTRQALHSVALSNGNFLDETYRFAMDYELWLRMAKKYEFNNYIDKPLSSFRMYGENLTGKNLISQQRELGRAFRASIAKDAAPERSHAFIIHVDSLNQDLSHTLQSLLSQSLYGFDILIADCTKSKEESRQLIEFIESLEDSTTAVTFRVVECANLSFFEAISRVCNCSTATIITVVKSGDILARQFSTSIHNSFSHDPYGALIHLGADTEHAQQLTQALSSIVQLTTLLDFKLDFVPFSFRSCALREVQGLDFNEPFCWHSFLMKLSTKGWLTVVDESSLIENLKMNYETKSEKFCEYQRAFLYSKLFRLTKKDIFYSSRVESGYVPMVHEAAFQYANEVVGAFNKGTA